MSSSILRTALVLGLLQAFGPFAIDMYLPSLPSIASDLGAHTAGVQASLTSFMAAIAICQLFYGPISDIIGRKPPLYFGMALYSIAAVGCAISPTIEWLVIARFFQGIGACAAMAIPRAIVRDGYTGSDAARLQGLLIMVFSVSPVIAPLAGSLIVETHGWRDVFWVIAAVGGLGILLVAFALRETRPKHARANSTISSSLRGYAVLFRDRHFIGLAMIGAFGMSGFLAYIANSSFILIGHYGLSPTGYSLMFSINAVSLVGGSQLAGVMTRRYGFGSVVRLAATGFAITMLALLGAYFAGYDSLPVLVVLLFIGYSFLGLILPTTAVLALEDHGEIAGTASALMGTLQLVFGAIAMAIVGRLFDGTPKALVICVAVCAVAAFILATLTVKSRPRLSTIA